MKSRIVTPKPIKRVSQPRKRTTGVPACGRIVEARSPKEIDKAKMLERLRKEYPDGVP